MSRRSEAVSTQQSALSRGRHAECVVHWTPNCGRQLGSYHNRVIAVIGEKTNTFDAVSTY